MIQINQREFWFCLFDVENDRNSAVRECGLQLAVRDVDGPHAEVCFQARVSTRQSSSHSEAIVGVFNGA